MTDESILESLISRFKEMPEKEFKKLVKETDDTLKNGSKKYRFIPYPGPQTEAYNSQADILLYGGQAGVGKGFLMLGLASQEHRSSIIFRREASQLDGLEKDGKEIFGAEIPYNGSDHEWNFPDGRTVKLAGMKEPDDWRKHAGRERGFIGYDEAGEFLEEQVASLLGWLRAPEGERCRLVLASNPPRSSDGFWLMKWFAPWISPTFHNPAKPGELRYAFGIGNMKDEIEWVDGPEPRADGTRPMSLTFLPARLKDNPARNTPEYRARLDSLPEPLRSQLKNGDFTAGLEDQDFQLIPTAWLLAAQARWTPNPPEGMAMTSMGYDPAGGGQDGAELAFRYGGWIAPIVTTKGPETADGSACAAKIIQHRRDNCPVVIGMGGGYGGSVTMRLKDNHIDATGFMEGEGTTGVSLEGKYPFTNKRSEGYWRLREALDPTQEGGAILALPPDPELISDLAAPTWKLTLQGIQVEPKVVQKDGKVVGGLRKKLGRSPGKGDAVMLCVAPGNQAVMRQKSRMMGTPTVKMGRDNRRRH